MEPLTPPTSVEIEAICAVAFGQQWTAAEECDRQTLRDVFAGCCDTMPIFQKQLRLYRLGVAAGAEGVLEKRGPDIARATLMLGLVARHGGAWGENESAEDVLLRIIKERDEARFNALAAVEQTVETYGREARWTAKMVKQRDEARAEVARLSADVDSLQKALDIVVAREDEQLHAAHRNGAEAMRERASQIAFERIAFGTVALANAEAVRDAIRALPLPDTKKGER